MKENKDLKLVVWCITYNQKEFIRDALDGFVIQRTNFPFKVFVHDDASTDGTTEIILEYASKFPDLIIPVVEKENQWKKGGLSRIIALMNEHYRCGEYIAFCEGDDFWTDSAKLQSQVAFLDEHMEYSMCFHSARKQYECESTAWINCEHIENRDYGATELFVNWTVPTASIVCRKDAMSFYASIKDYNKVQNYDIFVILSCAMVGKIRGMQKGMSVYRIQGKGLTYDNKALIQTTMRNPDHFICLKQNFPVVDGRSVNDTISKTFFDRAVIQTDLIHKSKDFWNSFWYHPSRFAKMGMKTFCKWILRR